MPEVTTSEIDAKDLPSALAEVATRLADVFGLPTSSLFPVCLALAGAAAGNSAKAKIPNWPGLLNSALHIALCDDTAGRLSQAVDLLLQPFREFRDAGLIRLRDGHQSLQEQRCLGPIVAEDPLPGQLATLLTVSTDASVLIVYHEEGLRRLLDAVAKPTAANDLGLLRYGWLGRTVSAAPTATDSSIKLILQPGVTCLLFAGVENLATLFGECKPLVRQLAEQLICLAVPEITSPPGRPPNLADVLGRWGHFVFGLLEMRQTGFQFVLELSDEAAEVYQKFWSQQIGAPREVVPGEIRIARNVPIHAAKLGLCSALILDRPALLPASVMAKSTTLAAKLAGDTTKLVTAFKAEHERITLERRAEKTVSVLSKIGKASPNKVRRHFDNQLKQVHEPVIEFLLGSGRVQRHPDGDIEVVPVTGNSEAGQAAGP